MSFDIAIITATNHEQDLLRNVLEEEVVSNESKKVWVTGTLCGLRLLLVETGIGAVNCAHALTNVLQSQDISEVWQIGAGGAYPDSQLSIGDIAVATAEHYGDIGVRMDDGWHGSEDTIGIPIVTAEQNNQQKPLFNSISLDADRAKVVSESLNSKWCSKSGPFVTVQECSGTDNLGQERGGHFGALCENMEGAAAAHICTFYNVNFFEMRAISNMVVKRDREKWDIALACQRAQEAVIELCEIGCHSK